MADPKLKAVAVVQQHQFGFPHLECLQPGPARRGLPNGVPLVLERERQGETDVVVVLDEEQFVHSPDILAARPQISHLLQNPHKTGGDLSQRDRMMISFTLPR